MKIYKVGGCVRDELLNRVPSDTDYVVVGATPEDFLKEHPGAKLIGNHFPVYLYDGSEYAFARTEVPSGQGGHTDFSVNFMKSVTLQEDLLRRDLTINSFAQDTGTGEITGSNQAHKDIGMRILRHTSLAFREDPLRVYRVARFASQFPEFSVAPETTVLMKHMADNGMLSNLTPERVFMELEKALGSERPDRFFRVLKSIGALECHFKELSDCIGVPAGHVDKHGSKDVFEHLMDSVSRTHKGKPYWKFASLCHDLGKALTPKEYWPKHHRHDYYGARAIAHLCDRLKVPIVYRKAALMFCNEHMRFHRLLGEMRPGKAVRTLLYLDTKFPGRINGFLQCAVSDGFDLTEAQRIVEITNRLNEVKLPEKYYGRGESCGQILLNLRASEYKRLTKGGLKDES